MVTIGLARGEVGDRRAARTDRALLLWGLTALAVAGVFVFGDITGVVAPPAEPVIPFADWLSAAMTWFTAHFRGVFRGLTWVLAWPLGALRAALQWLPWPAAILLAATLGYLAAGARLAAFCVAGLLYTVIVGYWEKTALTLALAGVAVPLSAAAGLCIGVLSFRSRFVRRLVEPTLDLMQTIPTFAYLIPILVLFGIGPVVSVAASAIYAVPPMVRNVVLGLDRVSVDVVESGIMSGSNRRQLLWWAQMPTALPTILIGLNQTIMAGLSMVVIAAMVGGVSDIGLEVFNTMKQAKFGESILSGLVIVILAMIMDRVSRGFAEAGRPRRRAGPLLIALVVAVLGIALLAMLVPSLQRYPESWTIYPAGAMNSALEWFTRTAFAVTSTLKAWAVYYLMLPLKLGLAHTVRQRSWGFEMSPVVSTLYAGATFLLCVLLAAAAGWRAALGLAAAAMFYYFGTTGVPWLAFMLIVAVLAWDVGGWRIGALTVAGLLFILLNGMWVDAMISIELCAVGVVISFVVGAGVGVWAALDDRVSALLRPVSDTLQTMPIFVFLIPAVMVFLVGEFTALIAVVMYAVVPSIRYTEHGIRTVPADAVEAARAMGATRRQLLWQVQLPLALPEIMLGLNQTIIMALAMVVVAALVGAQGLGQDVMIALNQADTGKGLVAGLSIAFVAIIADRVLQSWSRGRKRRLGLA